MRYIHLTISFLFLMLGCTVNAQQESFMSPSKDKQSFRMSEALQTASEQQRLFYDTGVLKEVRTLLDGRLEGDWKRYYDTGQLQKEGQFKNDEPHGTWKSYDRSGTITYIERYHNGIEHGEWKSFHPEGTLQVSGHFVHGKRQGKWYIYTTDGELEKVLLFKDDINIDTP